MEEKKRQQARGERRGITLPLPYRTEQQLGHTQICLPEKCEQKEAEKRGNEEFTRGEREVTEATIGSDLQKTKMYL
jgi:hypothetical protein